MFLHLHTDSWHSEGQTLFTFMFARIFITEHYKFKRSLDVPLGSACPHVFIQKNLAASSMLHEAKIGYYAFDVIVYCMYTHQTRIAYTKRTH